jgi:hypothetical protein
MVCRPAPKRLPEALFRDLPLTRPDASNCRPPSKRSQNCTPPAEKAHACALCFNSAAMSPPTAVRDDAERHLSRPARWNSKRSNRVQAPALGEPGSAGFQRAKALNTPIGEIAQFSGWPRSAKPRQCVENMGPEWVAGLDVEVPLSATWRSAC